GSCLELRFDPRHARDDYRGAAALARAALEKGERVWWNGDAEAAAFYGVPLTEKAAGREWVVWIQPDRKGFEAGLELPDLVLASKPDVYDGQGWLAEFLRRSGFHQEGALPAFTIWRRESPKSKVQSPKPRVRNPESKEGDGPDVGLWTGA